jgi:HicB family
MSTLSVRLPESLHEQLRKLAEKDGVSINQFITLAVAEKLTAMQAAEYFKRRASLGSRDDYDAVLGAILDVEPDSLDRLKP